MCLCKVYNVKMQITAFSNTVPVSFNTATKDLNKNSVGDMQLQKACHM